MLDAAAFHQALTQNLSLFLYTSTAHGYFERRAKGVAPVGDYANAACDGVAAALAPIAAELGIGGDYYVTRRLRAGLCFQYLYEPADLLSNPTEFGNSPLSSLPVWNGVGYEGNC